MPRQNGKMTKAEAGHLGGKATWEKYGPEHYADLARKSHQAIADKYFGGSLHKYYSWLGKNSVASQDAQTPYSANGAFRPVPLPAPSGGA